MVTIIIVNIINIRILITILFTILFDSLCLPAGPAPQPKAPPPAAKSVRGTASGPVVRGRNPIAAPAPPPKPSRTPAKGDEKAPPKKGGFLQSLGIGQDTAFVDELD
jgi:hypothetical protein